MPRRKRVKVGSIDLEKKISQERLDRLANEGTSIKERAKVLQDEINSNRDLNIDIIREDIDAYVSKTQNSRQEVPLLFQNSAEVGGANLQRISKLIYDFSGLNLKYKLNARAVCNQYDLDSDDAFYPSLG